jgi:predicted RecB family nuclease
MANRLDVSAVPLQGGYVAKQCPVVIQNQILVPELKTELSPEIQHRMNQGIQFEADMFERVRVEGPGDWVVIPSGPRELAQELTVEAMRQGVSVIEQAFLPPDELGRRTGRPDLLVAHGGGYVPVDVKHHRTLDLADAVIEVSDPMRPSPADTYVLEGRQLRTNAGDALQLAHYRRMLEALGLASTSTLAGVLGKEGVIVWYDLEKPMWQTQAKSDGKKRKVRTSLERYDFEFGFRLDIAATAIRHRDNTAIDLLVEPMSCGECAGCGFRDHCFSSLTAGSGDASLLPGVSYQQWRLLRDLGIVGRDHVAALHYPTALLANDDVDLPFFLDAADGAPASAPVGTLRPRAEKQLEALARAGVSTVGELVDMVDPVTASVGGFIAPRILDARAAIGPHSVYRRPGMSGTDLPVGDVEIDLDMENVNEGVYLWGALLNDHTDSGAFAEGYVPFVSWDPLDDGEELAVFMSLWAWLAEQRARVEQLGLTLRIYVWHEPAENSQLRRIAKTAEQLAIDVEDLIASDSWVDLKKVFERSWITGGSTGLKAIAPLAGHQWTVDDPGGGLSMVRYAEAIGPDPEVAETARRWLLDYNTGDVVATQRIREWLTGSGASWPEVPTS